MRCYFALSDDVSNNDVYYSMFICALESARKNTSFELHCLYDFRKAFVNDIEDDRIYKLLKKYNVIIHLISIDFESELLNVYTDDYLDEIHVTKDSLYSRFLRFMLPDVEKENEYVWYIDTDVIFLKDIVDSSISELPKTIGVCSESENNYTYTNFNAGVMLINVESYKNCKQKLISMLKNGERAENECCDQGYLNSIYKNNFSRLDNIYNWKPYWGINNNAVIVHLHGLKPRIEKNNAEGYIGFVSKYIWDNKKAKKGWKYYFSMFADYASSYVNKQIVMENIEFTLKKQRPFYFCFLFRALRKIRRIFKRTK